MWGGGGEGGLHRGMVLRGIFFWWVALGGSFGGLWFKRGGIVGGGGFGGCCFFWGVGVCGFWGDWFRGSWFGGGMVWRVGLGGSGLFWLLIYFGVVWVGGLVVLVLGGGVGSQVGEGVFFL